MLSHVNLSRTFWVEALMTKVLNLIIDVVHHLHLYLVDLDGGSGHSI